MISKTVYVYDTEGDTKAVVLAQNSYTYNPSFTSVDPKRHAPTVQCVAAGLLIRGSELAVL